MYTIEVSITIEKPIDLVWEYWTNPEHRDAWNFAFEDWNCTTIECDLTPGGRFHWDQGPSNGLITVNFSGTHGHIDPQKKVERILDDGRKVITTFTKVDGGINIYETFEIDNDITLEIHRKGVQNVYDSFKKYCENSTN